MSLNYGLGENFTTLVPITNGVCIFNAINFNMQYQYPNPPSHAETFHPISLISSESGILISSHSFKKTLPETDAGVIEYYIRVFGSVDGTTTDTKIAEYRPVLAKGTAYAYDINIKARVGDYMSQSMIDKSSAFVFGVKRKEDNKDPSLGFGGNEMTYIIMSPFTKFL